ncbi:unnamed protein product, partial [Prorocentrum cordatum]
DSPATASPVPSWRCKDSLTTGIRFHGGGSASCRELYNYCNHKTLDAHIRARCPMTCGACTPFLVKQVSNSSDSSSRSSAPSGPCEDDAADHVPVLFMGRKVMDCIDSKVFCFGHPNSKYIAKKCRATCGVCEVADAELEEADKMEPITTTLATVVAAAEPPPRLRWAELFSKAALGPVLVQAAGRRARRPRRRLRGPVPRRPQLGASVDAMPLGHLRSVQWGRATRNHLLFVRVFRVSSLLALRGGFLRPLTELLRSGCSGFPLRCTSRTGSQGWISCEGFLRPRPHCNPSPEDLGRGGAGARRRGLQWSGGRAQCPRPREAGRR